eukprot:10510567-Alexandrium_andersonii.AAC.1
MARRRACPAARARRAIIATEMSVLRMLLLPRVRTVLRRCFAELYVYCRAQRREEEQGRRAAARGGRHHRGGAGR